MKRTLPTLLLTALLAACTSTPTPVPTPTPTPIPTPTPTPTGAYSATLLPVPADTTTLRPLALNDTGEALLVVLTRASGTVGLPYISGSAFRAVPLPARAGFVNGFAYTGRPCLSDDGRAAFSPNADSAGVGNGLQSMYYDGRVTTPIPFPDQDSDAANGNGASIQGCSASMTVSGSHLASGVFRWAPGQTGTTLVDESLLMRAYDSSAAGTITLFGIHQGSTYTRAPSGMNPQAINEAGLVTGSNAAAGNRVLRFWTPGSAAAPSEIATPNTSAVSVLDLNARGEALLLLTDLTAGTKSYAVYTGSAFKTVAVPGWTLDQAVALNDKGEVLASIQKAGGIMQAAILKPN